MHSLSNAKSKGTILLIHSFPETSHRFRHVIQTLIASAGYYIITLTIASIACLPSLLEV